jgi:hypothetical protein
MNPQDILLTVVMAISGWNLLETIRLGKHIAAMQQRLADLPCDRPGSSCQ